MHHTIFKVMMIIILLNIILPTPGPNLRRLCQVARYVAIELQYTKIFVLKVIGLFDSVLKLFRLQLSGIIGCIWSSDPHSI